MHIIHSIGFQVPLDNQKRILVNWLAFWACCQPVSLCICNFISRKVDWLIFLMTALYGIKCHIVMKMHRWQEFNSSNVLIDWRSGYQRVLHKKNNSLSPGCAPNKSFRMGVGFMLCQFWLIHAESASRVQTTYVKY